MCVQYPPANGEVLVVMRYKREMDRRIRNCIIRMKGRIRQPGTEGRCLGVADKVGATLHCTTLHYTAIHCNTLQYSTLHLTELHYTAVFYTTPHCTTLHYTAVFYTTPHCTTLHYTAVFYTTPQCMHCTALHCGATIHCTT